MKMSSLITLGMYPLLRAMFGPKPRGRVRRAFAVIQFEAFGQPSESKLMKACKKLGMSDDEAEVIVERIKVGNNCPVFVDVDEADEFMILLKDYGFTMRHNEAYGCDPYIWDEALGKYQNLMQMTACRSCGRSPVRVFYRWSEENDCDEHACSSCSSSDVLHPFDLETNKEIEAYVKAYESFPSGSTGQGRRGSEASSDSEFAATAKRRTYG